VISSLESLSARAKSKVSLAEKSDPSMNDRLEEMESSLTGKEVYLICGLIETAKRQMAASINRQLILSMA
jgi:hypothetical protein